MDKLQFITAGSVDDGKSTLIGRLLYDSKSLLNDQLEVLRDQYKGAHASGINLAQLTDGLRAEREQGITIDVAYKYFSTKTRKFIIADAPGHVQYTRNLVTGASNANLGIILIDARKGVVEQTKRHSIILSLLGVPYLVFAINKMDLVAYSQEVYERIVKEVEAIARSFGLSSTNFIPISALQGDNVVARSENIPWYNGGSLLELLEQVEIQDTVNLEDARFPVQYVIRSQALGLAAYKGYAGRVISGNFKLGDKVLVLPAGLESSISAIENGLRDVEQAYPLQSIVMHLADELEVERGSLIVKQSSKPALGCQLKGMLCWMDNSLLLPGGRYLLQINSLVVEAVVEDILYNINIHTLEKDPKPKEARVNDLVYVQIKTKEPVPYDSYKKVRENGGAILIDAESKRTVAAFMIE